ncbi:hypothetical protein [Fontibacter flavus]|uniref:Uncharacterized protein n=1 Tax=Fontibacter flavus TaxID=654838 RepID=A0ABV6FQB1_9BACT
MKQRKRQSLQDWSSTINHLMLPIGNPYRIRNEDQIMPNGPSIQAKGQKFKKLPLVMSTTGDI